VGFGREVGFLGDRVGRRDGSGGLIPSRESSIWTSRVRRKRIGEKRKEEQEQDDGEKVEEKE